jgi:hypothetical protein
MGVGFGGRGRKAYCAKGRTPCFFLNENSSLGCVHILYADVCAAGKGVAKCRLKKSLAVLSKMKWFCILKAHIIQIVVGEGFCSLVFCCQISGKTQDG